MKKKIITFLSAAGVVIYASLIIAFSADVSKSAAAAINNCLTVIAPSLFAFMALTGFIVSTNLYKTVSRPFGLISRYVFKMPPEIFSAFIISAVSGYPAGAKMLDALIEEGKTDRKTAGEALVFCYSSGPAFICGAVGVRIYKSAAVGLLIFFSVLTSNLIIAFISGLRKKVPEKTSQKAEISLSFEKLVSSINSGALSLFSICAVIIFFSTAVCILEKLGIIQFLGIKISDLTGMSYRDCLSAVKSLIEISAISGFENGAKETVPILTALLSFGGISSMMQTAGIGKKFITKNFYILRIISMIISYFCCKIAIDLIDYNKIVQTSSGVAAGYRQISPIPSLFLLIMTVLLLSKNYVAKTNQI